MAGASSFRKPPSWQRPSFQTDQLLKFPFVDYFPRNPFWGRVPSRARASYRGDGILTELKILGIDLSNERFSRSSDASFHEALYRIADELFFSARYWLFFFSWPQRF